VHQQRLAEVSIDDEIQVLFEEYLIMYVFEQVTNDRRSIVLGERVLGPGLGEIVEAVRSSARMLR